MEWITGNLTLILCALAGFGLLMTEAFMPGFGIAGISGIVLEVIAVYMVWTAYGLGAAVVMTLAVILIIALAIFLSYRSAMNGRLSKSDLILKDTQEVAEPKAHALLPWVGTEAVVATPLRPAGQIETQGKRLPAASSGDFIEKGVRVRVVGTQGDHLIVQPV